MTIEQIVFAIVVYAVLSIIMAVAVGVFQLALETFSLNGFTGIFPLILSIWFFMLGFMLHIEYLEYIGYTKEPIQINVEPVKETGI